MSIIRKSYAETSEGQVHYREVHRVAGTPLVLLHQTASSGVMFEPVMTLLSDSFHTLALDTPGFGASFLPPSGFSIRYLSDSLYAALHQLGVESCFMFGHHTGSAIAVQMAHDHPDFIQKMILSGAPLLNESQINGLKASLKPFAIAEDGSHLTQVWERIRKRDSALALGTVHREVLLTQSAREAAQSAFQAVFDQPFAEQLSALEIPILVMSGENDTLRASLEPAFSILKNGEMKLIPNEGPYICDQNPQAVADVLHEFFEEMIMEQKVDRQQIEIRRKLRMQLVDRLVGWFTLFCYFFPIVGRLLNAQGMTNFDDDLMQTFSNLFWIMIFLHSIAALYLYGIPLFKKNLRIVNLYLGIAILALIFIDRSISRFETAEQIVATLIMIPALFHSLIGVRLILQRVLRKQWDAPIPFYTGGNISRDV